MSTDRDVTITLTADQGRTLEMLVNVAVTQWPAHLLAVDDDLIDLQRKVAREMGDDTAITSRIAQEHRLAARLADHYREALEAIVADDELWRANEAAFAVHAARRMRQQARWALDNPPRR